MKTVENMFSKVSKCVILAALAHMFCLLIVLSLKNWNLLLFFFFLQGAARLTRVSLSAIISRIPTMTLTGHTSTPRKCHTCRQTCRKVRFLTFGQWSSYCETRSFISETKEHTIYAALDYFLFIVYLHTQFILLCNKNSFCFLSFWRFVMPLCKVLLSSPLFSLFSCYFLRDNDEGEIKSLCLQAEGLINKIWGH